MLSYHPYALLRPFLFGDLLQVRNDRFRFLEGILRLSIPHTLRDKQYSLSHLDHPSTARVFQHLGHLHTISVFNPIGHIGDTLIPLKVTSAFQSAVG